MGVSDNEGLGQEKGTGRAAEPVWVSGTKKELFEIDLERWDGAAKLTSLDPAPMFLSNNFSSIVGLSDTVVSTLGRA
jgi:hypothetical protein